jgi:rRNA maturation endonuclease Nob1
MSILADTSTSSQLFDDATSNIMFNDAMIELQIELKGAVALATELKSENDDLKRQLESHIAFSNANLQRHAEWKDVWKKEREVVSMREKQLEMDESKWKMKLEERRKEMAEIDRKLNDSGVVLAGGAGLLDLMKEIQIEYQNKIERLMNEASSWREECHGCRKSFGELEARHEEMKCRFDRERYAAESFEKEIASLQQALSEHVNGTDRNDTASPSLLEVDLARDLKLQVDENDSLLHELNSTRKARDDALCANDELFATHQRERSVSAKADLPFTNSQKTLLISDLS